MTRTHVWFMASLALAAAGITALAGPGDLYDALLQRPAVPGTVVVPDHLLREWDPVTVFFDQARGKAGPEDDPSKLVQMDPAHPGAWTWLDARTLQFRPAEPWPPLSLVSMRADRTRTDLFTLIRPPSQSQPYRNQQTYGPVDRIELGFDVPLDRDTLARLTTIEVRPLPGLSDEGLQVLGSDDFEVKVLPRNDRNEPWRVALLLRNPIDRGAAVSVKLGLSLDAEAEDAVEVLRFRTPEPFRVTAMGCTNQTLPASPTGMAFSADQPLDCTGTGELVVTFNASPAALGPLEGRNLVRFEPAVPGLTFALEGTELRVSGSFETDRAYRVNVHPTPLLDEAGRQLDLQAPNTFSVRFPSQTPFVRLTTGQGVVERFGPRRVALQGRSVEEVDVRIYAVDPLNRELWPFGSEPIPVNEARRPPGPGEEPPPLGVTSTASRDTLARHLQMLGSPAWSGVIPAPLGRRTGTVGLDLGSALDRVAGKDAPGHYLVGLRELGGGTIRNWMRLQVTDLALSTVETDDTVTFLVTSLSTGRPVPGARVTIEGVTIDQPPVWRERASLVMGSDGTATWKAPGTGNGDVRRLVVTHRNDQLVLDANDPPESFAQSHWRNDRQNWLGWAFRKLDARGAPAVHLGHLFPERPVYRPGEPVHLKGYGRIQTLGMLSHVKGKARFEIKGPNGEWSVPTTFSAMGSVSTTWTEPDLPTGVYTARLLDEGNRTLASTSFQIEAYQLPTFELSLTTPNHAQDVPSDAPFTVDATASYYAGGSLAHRPVSWSISQFPYSWDPAGPKGFLYSSDGRYSHQARFDSTPASTRRGTTSANGRAELVLDPGLEPSGQPRTYVIEATVTDADESTVTATHRVNAVPAFALGLKAPRYQDKAGRLAIEVVAVGPDGALMPLEGVQVRLVQRQWHSVLQAGDFTEGSARYVTDVVDVPIDDKTISTGSSAPTELVFQLPEAGVYVVEVEARDRLGRAQFVTTDLFAGGKGDLSWAKAEQGVFAITTDEPSYQPGQTARLVLQSPYSKGEALVVVEAPTGNILSSAVITNGTATVSVPVGTGWVPRIPVHVLLRKGRDDSAGVAGPNDLGKPETVATTTWLKVDPVENTVNVAVSNPERAMPGETIEVTVKLNDPKGKPVGGEVALWLVDQAVLALGREQALDPRPDFIRARASRARFTDTRNEVLGRLPFHEMPGGDGEEEADSEPEGLLDNATVRRNFSPVPYYEPALQVPASGVLTVKVPLPDNLTVFKIRAKAASGTARFGAGTSSLRVRLPVLLQPNLPRFVRPGDALTVGGLARVVEGGEGSGTAEIAATGLTIKGSARVPFQWSKEDAVGVTWEAEVPTPADGADPSVSLTIGALRKEDGAKDALQVTLPVRPDRRPRTEAQLARLEPQRTVTLDALSEPARPGTLTRQVVAADHEGLVKMATGLDLLLRRTPRDTGMIIDRSRAWIGVGALREPLGMKGDDLVKRTLAEAMAHLTTVADARGLIAAWPGGTGQVALTADALELLVDAEQAGHTVDVRLRKRLVDALTPALRSDYGAFLNGSSWYERTRALQAVTRAGAPSPSTFNELAERSALLGTLGRSQVLLAAVSAGQGTSSTARTLVASLEADVVVGLYQGQERYQGLQGTGAPTSPLIGSGEAFTLATMTRSLLAADVRGPRTELLVDALVRLGGEDGWGGRADAPALLALADRLNGRSGTPFSMTVGGTALAPSSGVGNLALSASGPVEVVHRSGPAATLYSRATYVPLPSGAKANAVQQGFVVSRTVSVVGGTRTALDEGGREIVVKRGEIVEEHVQVVVPETRAMVVVSVPLAAGLQPMNPNLRTSGADAQPSKRDSVQATWRSYGDDEVLYAFESLPKGTHDLYFRTRGTTVGRFVQPPASAEVIPEPAVYGGSPGAWIVVR